MLILHYEMCIPIARGPHLAQSVYTGHWETNEVI